MRQVWQYTTEFQGPHTRNNVLRGGSSYSPKRDQAATDSKGPKGPKGSRWYFRETDTLDTYNTYHLMSGSYERASTVGFRCVSDAEDDCGTGGALCVTLAGDEQGQGVQGQGLHLTAASQPQLQSRSKNLTTTSNTNNSVIGARLFVSPLQGAMITTSSTQRGLPLVFPGLGNGFVVTAPAPANGHRSTLRLHVGSTQGTTSLRWQLCAPTGIIIGWLQLSRRALRRNMGRAVHVVEELTRCAW